MKNEEQLKAVEAVRSILPKSVTLETKENKYGHLVVEIFYEDSDNPEIIVLSGYNKTWCAKAILNSAPVSMALE